MNSTPETTQLFECIKQLSDSAVEKLLKAALEALELESNDFEVCPYCGGSHFVRYGKKQGKQRLFCKDCKRTFVTTTHTLMLMSHQPVSVWKEVLSDTINGDAIDYTAKREIAKQTLIQKLNHKFFVILIVRKQTVAHIVIPTIFSQTSSFNRLPYIDIFPIQILFLPAKEKYIP